jgi:AGZA family xanthine/uracil permease-like MFS transporter
LSATTDRSVSENEERPVNNSSPGRLDRFFGITKLGSSVSTEIRAGFITYLAMCYILFLNPTILGSVKDGAGHTLAFNAVLTATALVAGGATICMGLFGKAPLGLAAGLGINAFVAYGLVGAAHLTWPEAMGLVVSEGIVMVVLVYVRNIRERLLNAIPVGLRHAIAVGIGLFILEIGLVNAGLVMPGHGTLVAIAPHVSGWPLMIFVFGLFVTSALVSRGLRGALLYGIVLTTVLAVIVNTVGGYKYITDGSARLPQSFITPDFHLVGAFSFHYWAVLGVGSSIAAIVALTMSDLFDNAGTTYGVLGSAGLLNPDGSLPKAKSRLGIDSFAALAGGVFSTSANTTYIESAAGVESGGRTGLTAIVTGVLFLASLVLAPIAGMVPAVATAPILVIVGCFMFRKVGEIDWKGDFTVVISAVLTIAGMVLTYSITNGIGFGFVTYTIVSALSGKYKAVHPALYVVSAIFCWYFVHGAI